jgi:hypothetical protein
VVNSVWCEGGSTTLIDRFWAPGTEPMEEDPAGAFPGANTFGRSIDAAAAGNESTPRPRTTPALRTAASTSLEPERRPLFALEPTAYPHWSLIP